MRKPKIKRAKESTKIRLNRRKMLSGLALTTVGFAAGRKLLSGGALAADEKLAPAQPIDHSYRVVEVGPGKRFESLTLAGVYMNGGSGWENTFTSPDKIARTGFRVIVSPGPPGYYVNDSGSHSRRWPSMVGWPPYEGVLFGPVIIEGEAGKPAPVLETDGSGDGVLYYQTGLFQTASCDATFRHLIFKGFRRSDGQGNYAAVRLGEEAAKIPMNSHVLFEDCEFTNCDNGIMGGSKGQTLALRRCFFHDNGNETGRVHNVYFGEGDLLTVEDTLSTRCTIGHLLKTRAVKTVIRNTRLLGNNGSESACLDVPDAGVLDIDGLICEKSPNTDASWLIHYAGENQDRAGVPFHTPSSITIRNLTMVAPPVIARHTTWPVIGFANESGAGEETSGKGAYLVKPDAQGVKVFGMTEKSANLPCTVLSAKPALDLTSPIQV